MKTPWNWLSFLAGLGSALLVLGGIWIAIAVTGAQQAQQQADYEACLAALGFTRGAPGDDVDALIAAAELCSR